MREGVPVNVSPQHLTILAQIEAIHRDTWAPVKTIAVASRIYMSDRQTRRYLVALEAGGVVRRVGKCGGWLPVAA